PAIRTPRPTNHGHTVAPPPDSPLAVSVLPVPLPLAQTGPPLRLLANSTNVLVRSPFVDCRLARVSAYALSICVWAHPWQYTPDFAWYRVPTKTARVYCGLIAACSWFTALGPFTELGKIAALTDEPKASCTSDRLSTRPWAPGATYRDELFNALTASLTGSAEAAGAIRTSTANAANAASEAAIPPNATRNRDMPPG